VRPTTERLSSTPLLACCLGLLKDSHDLDEILEPVARNWLQVVGNDEDEQERLKLLATDVIRTFKINTPHHSTPEHSPTVASSHVPIDTSGIVCVGCHGGYQG
jgi:hypothetical protein